MFDSSRYQSGCDPISIWYDVINARLFFKPKFRFFFCVWVKLSILSYLKQTESSKRNLNYDVFVFCFGCCSMHCTLQLFTWKYPHKARHGSILIAAAAITSSCFGWLFFPLENKNPLTWELHSCSFSLNFFFSLFHSLFLWSSVIVKFPLEKKSTSFSTFTTFWHAATVASTKSFISVITNRRCSDYNR